MILQWRQSSLLKVNTNTGSCRKRKFTSKGSILETDINIWFHEEQTCSISQIYMCGFSVLLFLIQVNTLMLLTPVRSGCSMSLGKFATIAPWDLHLSSSVQVKNTRQIILGYHYILLQPTRSYPVSQKATSQGPLHPGRFTPLPLSVSCLPWCQHRCC